MIFSKGAFKVYISYAMIFYAKSILSNNIKIRNLCYNGQYVECSTHCFVGTVVKRDPVIKR